MYCKLITRTRMRLTLLASGIVLGANTWCSFGDAVIDGFFSGISNTIASLLSSLVLASGQTTSAVLVQ